MLAFSLHQFACNPSHGVLLLWNMMPCHCVIVFKTMLWSQKIRKSLPSVGITSQKNRILSDAATKICNPGDCLLFVQSECIPSHFETPVLTLDCVVHVCTVHQQYQVTYLLFQTDAHNYKIIGILKQLKFRLSL